MKHSYYVVALAIPISCSVALEAMDRQPRSVSDIKTPQAIIHLSPQDPAFAILINLIDKSVWSTEYSTLANNFMRTTALMHNKHLASDLYQPQRTAIQTLRKRLFDRITFDFGTPQAANQALSGLADDLIDHAQEINQRHLLEMLPLSQTYSHTIANLCEQKEKLDVLIRSISNNQQSISENIAQIKKEMHTLEITKIKNTKKHKKIEKMTKDIDQAHNVLLFDCAHKEKALALHKTNREKK